MKTKLALLLAFLATHFFTAVSAKEVAIPDARLKAAKWENLGRAQPVGTLTEQDMLSLTNLYAADRGVRSVEGLGAAHNLATLDFSYNQLTNLTLPAGLTSLTEVFLRGNRLTSLTLPADLTSLTTLDLSFSTSADFGLDGDVSHLTALTIRGDPIGSRGPLTRLTLPVGLSGLTTLNLYKNQLTSLTLPDGLTSLTTLDLHYNHLTSLTLPAGLTSLTTLNLVRNQLTSLTLPADLTSLTALELWGSPLQSLVVPEPLATGLLAPIFEELVGQGVSVSIYLPGLILAAITPNDGGAFDLLLTGPPGNYRIQVTEDLADFSSWTDLSPVTIDANGSVKVSDPSAKARPHSFYRVVRAN